MNSQDKKVEYKKKLDEIHAPEALIQNTLNKIHAEEPAKKPVKKRFPWAAISTVAAAAAVVIAIGLTTGGSSDVNLIYNTVPETLVRTVGEQPEYSMNVDEYSTYLGVDLEHLVKDADLVKAEIYAKQEGGTVTEDEATIIYNINGEQMTVQISKTLNVAPQTLTSGQYSDVNGYKVLAALSENGKERMAAFEWNGISCFVMSYSMEAQEFEDFLEDFLDE